MWSHFGTLLGLVLGLFLLARVMRGHHSQSVTLAWLMAIILIPYVGVPLYLLLGGRKIRALASRKHPLYEQSGRLAIDAKWAFQGPRKLLGSYGMPDARDGNDVDLLLSGESAYGAMAQLVDGAERYVHVSSFILGKDEVGRSIVEMLAGKARQGVEVRLLLDALGSLHTRGRFVRELRSAGGRVAVFMPMLPIHRRFSANLRNHRKLMLVDGRGCMLGGMNLAREYMGPTPLAERWIDVSAIVRGPVVQDFERIWSFDWRFATGEDLVEGLTEGVVPPGASASLQVVASGPDTPVDAFRDTLLLAIVESRQRIWIVTPYFTPDEALLNPLVLQARLGLDVRVVVPLKSNHLLADLARARCLRELERAGAKVLVYPERMVHAKAMVFDSELAVMGSANFDARSLYLNYEVAMLLHSSAQVAEVTAWMEALMERCRPQVDGRPSVVRELAEDLSFLVSPLL